MLNKTRSEEQNQQGFAAIVVAITLVIVMSLLTVGFAQLMRNEQNQVTNRQLSNQAYYAAESGVNDAALALKNGYLKHKTTCGKETGAEVTPFYNTTNSWKNLADNNVGANGTQWTCLLIDPAPVSVQYGDVDTVTPTIFTASGADGKIIKTITVSWQDTSAGVTSFRSPGDRSFPVANQWGASPGVVHLSITPLLLPLSRAALVADTFNVFLYPNRSNTTGQSGFVNYSTDPTQQGSIVDGKCNTGNTTTRFCSATIQLDAAHFLSGTDILFSLRSIYSDANVYITQNDDSGPVRFSGAQALVDSTGRSQDVLKRIQVRIPLRDQFYFPGFSLASTDGICKQLVLPFQQIATGCPLPNPG